MTASQPLALSQGIVINDRFTSFPDLEERVKRLAGGLAALGIKAGDSVAILLRNDTPFLEVTYGAMLLGAYAVPINWHFRTDEVLYILEDCGAKVLVAHSDLLMGLDADLPAGITVIEVDTAEDIVAREVTMARRRALEPAILDYAVWVDAQTPYAGPPSPPPQSMIYTSGTTGRPKGVRRDVPTPEQVAAVARMRSELYGLTPGLRAMLAGPMYHSAPNAFAVRAGQIAELFVIEPYFDPERFLQVVEAHRIDTTFMVPTMFIRLLRLPEEVRARYDVSSLRHVVHAGSPCPVDVKKAMIDWLGPIICEYYGGTESGAVTFITSPESLRKPGSVGKAFGNTILRIYDDAGNVLPAGEIGHIYMRMLDNPDFTYHNAPEKRDEIGRDELITCGDMGYLDEDGYLYISDRKNDMVISGGVNIYPAEIESVLIQLPGVKDCAVFGIPHPEFGESLIAFVEPLDGMELDIAALRQQMAEKLAGYKIPRQIEIRHDLPREDSGKIFKKHLRAPYWEGAGRTI